MKVLVSTIDIRPQHEEFVRWFDVATAGPSERYQAVAKRIWEEVVPRLKG